MERCKFCGSEHEGDCRWEYFQCITCHQEFSKATMQFVGIGHPMSESYECMPCHTERTGETLSDVALALIDKIVNDDGRTATGDAAPLETE